MLTSIHFRLEPLTGARVPTLTPACIRNSSQLPARANVTEADMRALVKNSGPYKKRPQALFVWAG